MHHQAQTVKHMCLEYHNQDCIPLLLVERMLQSVGLATACNSCTLISADVASKFNAVTKNKALPVSI